MKPWLQLARISNLPTVWTNVIAAWLIGGGDWQDHRLQAQLIAGSLLYTGGMILNDAADVKFDREHRQERPIPSGAVTLGEAWGVGLTMLAVGAALAVLFGAGLLITAALVVAILFYDLYHKPWAGSVLVMGACRTLLYLMAASASSPNAWAASTITLPGAWTIDTGFLPAGVVRAFPCAFALGAYVVGITIAARREHVTATSAPRRLLSVFLVLLFFSAPLVVWCLRRELSMPFDGLVPLALGALLSLPVGWISKGGPLIGKGVGWLLAGIVIVDALAVSSVSVPLALGFAALAPVLRLWQRWVAAT